MTDRPDQPDPKTLGDLEPVRYLTVHDRMTELDVICQRCWCCVPEEYVRQHTDWHTAIEAAQQGFTVTMQGRTFEITEEFIAEALTNEGARRLARELSQPERAAEQASTVDEDGDAWCEKCTATVSMPHYHCAQCGKPSSMMGHLGNCPATANARQNARNAPNWTTAQPHTGPDIPAPWSLDPAELDRLRRVESDLIELGAPHRSEPGDPGGRMIEWARELVTENKLLRRERDRFAAELEAARGEDAAPERRAPELGEPDLWITTDPTNGESL